jgi:TIR domain
MSSINVFISYSHADDALRKRLETHLNILQRQGVIRMWSDRAIEPGIQFEDTILSNLRNADIVLLLISADFLASDFCQDIELTQAMERHHSGQARVIPVFLSSCDWKHAQFGKLQGVPDDAKPITQWSDRDEAFTRVCSAIRKAAEAIMAARAARSDQSAGDKKISVDFSKIHDIIDWEKVNAKVIDWADLHHAENPYDMGPRNYQKCLYDIGLGGEDYRLEYENGRLKRQ